MAFTPVCASSKLPSMAQTPTFFPSCVVICSFIKAGKRFDMLILPGQRHGFGNMNEYFFWKMADYYARYLMGDDSPRPTDISEMNND